MSQQSLLLSLQSVLPLYGAQLPLVLRLSVHEHLENEDASHLKVLRLAVSWLELYPTALVSVERITCGPVIIGWRSVASWCRTECRLITTSMPLCSYSLQLPPLLVSLQ